jgi:2-dehydro-3-deoxygluconokinase
MAERPSKPRAVTCGEVLIATLPVEPVPIDAGEPLRMYVGGAEANFAVGLCRLGLDASLVGRLSSDPLGRFATVTLEGEGVDLSKMREDDGPSGLYLREWLADGVRRPLYYRRDSAGSHFGPDDWPANLDNIDWLHVTGITAALSESCRAGLTTALSWAREHSVRVSFDPNYRSQLWSPEAARASLLAIVASCHTLLLGTSEGELLFGTDDPRSIGERAGSLGVQDVAIKRGDRGASAWSGGEMWHHEPFEVRAVDPVGAGDAFDAGFVACRLESGSLQDALALGTYCGAKVAELPGEHEGFPRLAELPSHLARTLGN